MTVSLPVLIVIVFFGGPILLGVLYGTLLRFGHDPLGIMGGTINPADEPLKAAVDVKHERKAQREADTDEH